MRKRPGHGPRHTVKGPDLEETKAHIFIAGHELLKAAEGMLKFCKDYVEATSECRKHPHVKRLFTKGISIARELGQSMSQESILQKTGGKILHHFCDTMEKEMRREKAAAPKRKSKKKKQAKGRTSVPKRSKKR
jgi:hypothetical protein